MCPEDKHQTLASSAGLGSISVCGCGTLSLHVGGVSIRMDLTAFVQTAEMFRTAVAHLEAQARTLQPSAIKAPSLLTH
jgi:hypothetical protein